MFNLIHRFLVSLLTFGIGVLCVATWHQNLTSHEIQATPVPPPHSEPLSNNQENFSKDWEEYFGTPLVWKFLLNDEQYGRLAVVRAAAQTPNGTVRAKLRLDCPSTKGSVKVLVGDMDEAGFNLSNYAVKSDSPVVEKTLVEVRAVSPKGELSFKTKAEGTIGYSNLYPTVIFFELVGTNKLERLIAKGSTEVTFIIHDIEDYEKTITVTFPAIGPNTEIAKGLNGCRR